MEGIEDLRLVIDRILGSSVDEVTELAGGFNAETKRAIVGEEVYVVKRYSSSNRWKAERDFLKQAERLAPTRVARLIQDYEDERINILEYVDGKKYSAGEVATQKHVDELVDFFFDLNSDRAKLRRVFSRQAAEGFLTLNEHIDNVKERIQSIAQISYSNQELVSRVNSLISIAVQRIQLLEALIEELVKKGYVKDKVDQTQIFLSPSDFGFHNAIIRTDRCLFIDFEYAGWDDIAKLASDLVLQPKVKLGPSEREAEKAIGKILDITVSRRYRVLKEVLRLKWSLIIAKQATSARDSAIFDTQWRIDRLERAISYAKAVDQDAAAA